MRGLHCRTSPSCCCGRWTTSYRRDVAIYVVDIRCRYTYRDRYRYRKSPGMVLQFRGTLGELEQVCAYNICRCTCGLACICIYAYIYIYNTCVFYLHRHLCRILKDSWVTRIGKQSKAKQNNLIYLGGSECGRPVSWLRNHPSCTRLSGHAGRRTRILTEIADLNRLAATAQCCAIDPSVWYWKTHSERTA